MTTLSLQNNQITFGTLKWSHPALLNIPADISSQAISIISFHKDYVKVIPLTIDATPLNYNIILPDTRNNS